MTRNRLRPLAAYSLAALGVTAMQAQDGTPLPSLPIRTTSYMVGVGPTRLLDTYLSQEHFGGTGFTFLASTERRKQPSASWITLMEHQANLATLNDRADKTHELEGSYRFFWGRLHEWKLMDDQLSLQAGGMGVATLGFIYNTIGGNNPAQARAAIHIMPTAAANYRFSIRHCRMAIRYELQMPLLGLMFSPNYGQSYYEIFSRGNFDHNIVPTTMVSSPSFRQQLAVDIGVSRRLVLRVGYLGDYEQARANQLKQHIYSHRLMVGVVKRFQILSFRP